MSWYVYPTTVRRPRFSRTELRHILLAVLALILAFTLFLSGGIFSSPEGIVAGFIIASIAVPTGFLLHEMGHKVVAQRYGCWAEFRSYTYGLFLAVITAFLGFIFAAPGAVVIGGNVDRRQNGIISAAGPLVNLGIGAGFMALWLSLLGAGINPIIVGNMSALVLARWVALINLFLGAFNMIPFPPLDGSKVVRWNPGVYGLLLAAIVGLLVLLYTL
ncbi:MAG: M50 family metallopeptidase [Thermoplasmata archaeon]